MSGHETILGHLATWGLSQRYEDTATEGLAFLLRRDPTLRKQFVALLQKAQPGLPDNLRFTTQETFDGCRIDMCGRTDSGAPVFIENKFWAALTGNQPVAYLERLARQQVPSLLLFIVPERRRASLWPELLSRLTAGGVAYQAAGAHRVEIVGTQHS
ncbi:MAG TPA: PD-(D/E)XK nuclease family protein, partial [Nannocystis sp.]